MNKINLSIIVVAVLFLIAGVYIISNRPAQPNTKPPQDEGSITHTAPVQEKSASEEDTMAQSINSEAVGPQVAVNESEYDFGKIYKQDGIVQKEFTIQNTGSETLTFGEITSSCGCTSGIVDSETVEPGEKAMLTVFFDPNFHEEPEGKFERTVFVPTNDPSTPELEFTISVEIVG